MVELITSASVTFKESLEALILLFSIVGTRQSDFKEKMIIFGGIVSAIFVAFLISIFIADVVLLEVPSIIISIGTIIVLLYLAYDSKNGSSGRTEKLLELAHTSLPMLFVASFLVVLRESLEVVAATSTLIPSNAFDVLIGVATGLILIVLLAETILKATSKIPKSYIFKFCNWTFVVMAIYYLYELI